MTAGLEQGAFGSMSVHTGGTHQILSIERHVIPPWRHKLVVAVQDATVHVLIATRVKEGLEPTESEEQHSVSENNSI